MQIFIYEFVTAGGWPSLESDGVPPASMFDEGLAMLSALAADFSQIAGAEVNFIWDRRRAAAKRPPGDARVVADADDELDAFLQLAAAADWTVVIAPEFCGTLHSRCRQVEMAGGRLLGPSSNVVALASDKQQTAEHLAASAVAVPRGRGLDPDEALPGDFPYPAVVKPRDSAGSQGVRLVKHPRAQDGDSSLFRRLERFHEGMAASVSFLCGPAEQVPLVPCRQLLSEDGRFKYLGGELPLAPALARRAIRLASRAIAALGHPIGYLGVDLILGPDASGSDDVVIEINPRLTTSYVGLRAASVTNLAQAMLSIATGDRAPLSFSPRAVKFDARGTILKAPAVAHEVAGD